ncbi:TPA: hypothetical protein ACGR2K_000565 [Escherichia coli]
MTTITDKKQYPSDQYLNELVTNMEFAARAPVEVVRAMAAELQKRREADSAEPVSQTYNLPELIEGMEVSIDVSTCDADLGNRYFGTVTEALELDTAKNGYILLVQDAEPNFDVNGNSPVTPDGYADMLQRWLVFGIGMLKAGSQLPRNLIAETKAMVAALQQEDE